MMKKVLASLVMLFAGISVFSQNYNLPYSGTTPVTSCSGSIFDPGGPTGNYSNGCSGSILLSNPSGLPINFILASFYTESGYDYLTIYDGNSNSAPVVRQFNGYYSGTTSFSSTSPVVLIEFESDNSGTYEGFRLNFSSPAGGSSVFADFVAPSGNLPVNWPIQFTNTGSNDAGYRWEFGDGGTSTDKHPSHSFSYGGTFPVKLVTRNCVAQDSITKNVTIDAAPVISVTPASLNVSISGCNDSVTVPLTIKNTGLGVLSFNATENSGSEDFEDGLDYSLWTNVVGGSVQIGCPEGGNNTNALYFNSNNAKYAETTTLDLSSLDTLHYDLYLGGSTPGCSLVENGYNVYLSYSVDGGITYTQIADYFNQGTVGFEHQAVVIPVAARTANTVLRWSQPYGYYLNYNNWGLDNIRFKKSAKVTCSPASASVEAGQELVVNVTVYSGGMTAGTYASSVTITNNQPGREIINVPLTYTIVGAASLESNKACIDFGTLQQNESKTDSLLLSNTGCKAVFLNSSSTTSAEFSDSYSSGNLAAFGSQKIAVTFSPTTVGNFSDTLTIVSPSGSVKVCLKGTSVPSPEFYITPDSVSVTINSCNDSVTIPVTIYNTGQGPMTFSVDSSSFGGSKRILLVDVENASGLTSYQNMKSLILAEHPGAVTETTGSPDFAANLKNFDVVILPQVGNGDPYQHISNNLAAYTAYLNQGGTFLTNDYAAIYYTNYFGMAPGNYIYNGDLVTNALPGAAAAQGLPSSFAFDYNGGIVMAPPTGTGTDNILTSNTYYSALTSTNVGTGKAYYCAHNYGVSSVPFETVLSNIINSASGNASWATINQYSGNVAAGSSQTVYVKIKSEGLQNGTYRFVAQINTNDPLHKLVNYPISVTVNGTAGISVSSPCVAFGSIMEKTKKTLAKAITNTGCDTLRITSFVSTDAAYSVAPATFNIAPGKTDSAYITFYPQSTGSFPATITVNSNAGSASICVTGTATPAPVITSNPTSVTVNLGSCDEDQAKINITLSNTGQSTLNWTKYNVKKLSDPFDSYNYNIWSNIGGYVGNSCNTYQGSGMEFYYYDRYMITNSFPVYLGELSFYLKTGGCDVAEASKKIRIAYSLNGGFTWVDFMVLDPTAYATTFRKVVATIPAAAYSGATSFKIYQPTHDGTYLDTWTMDNFEIAVSEVDYNTVPNSGTISVGGSRSLTTTITNNGLTGGTYYDTLYFASNDPVNPIYRVPVTTIVSSVPCVNYSYAVGGCSGVVSFSDSTKNAVSTYKWTFGDGGTSTDKSPSHSYTAAGTYSVQLIACNGSGCDTLSKNVVITGVGGPKAACTPDGYTCCGYGIETVLMGDINNTSTVGNLYQDFSCSNSTNVKRGQTYKLRVYTGYSYMDGVVWVDFNNNGAFATNERFVLTSISAYSMEANIVVPSTAVQNTPLRMRILTADYISTPDPCYITYGEFEDYSLNVTSGVGIDEQYHTETPVNIYPNPATTAINISLGEQFPIDQVDILDAVGRIVLTQKENGNTASLVQVGDLAKGNYIVRITSSGNTYHRQFSKQ